MSATAEQTSMPHPPRPSEPGRLGAALAALGVAGLCAAGVAAIAYLALHTARGQDLDDRAMRVFSDNGDPEAARPLLSLLGDISVGSAALALLVFMALALLRRGFALAAGAAVLVAGANITTQVLKRVVLYRPDLDTGTLNSLPSGHTTLVFSLVFAAMLVAPVRLRVPVTLIGATVGTLTGAATVVAGWHRPADVVTSTLITLGWGAVTVAVLAMFTPAPRRPSGRGLVLLALVGSAAASVLLVAWGVGPGPGPGEVLAAVLSMGSVALAAAATVGLFARLLQRTVG